MAHVRRGRMGYATHNVLNVAAGKPVVDLKRNVLGGGIAKRIVTRAALKNGIINNIINVCLFPVMSAKLLIFFLLF